MTPFNIDILILNKDVLKWLYPVTSLAIMDTGTQNFDQNGLFSTKIFGQVGSQERNITFGYIDTKIPVLHPLIYQHLLSLKTLYKDIIEGRKYGKYDPITKDIIETTIEDGRIGLDFIIEYIDRIDLKDNGSDERSFKIRLVKKYAKNDLLINHWLVLPAGLRDYTVDSNNRPTEDEVNNLYRKLLANVNTLININVKNMNSDILNPIRLKIQNTIVAIYEYYRVLIDGKSKFILGKWAKRAIVYGTRNVITAIPYNVTSTNQENKISFNDTVIGLYQFIAGISPIAKNKIITTFINRIFRQDTNIATLVNKKSMMTESVAIDYTKRDMWLSFEGLDSIVAKMAQEENRFEKISVGEDHYLMLIYDDGTNVKLVFNTETLPEDINKKYLRPITYAELFYISIYSVRNKYPAFVTRYPVASLGGIYPSKLYVKTTSKGRTVNFNNGYADSLMYEYPIIDTSFYNSMSPHTSKIGNLGADFDGDPKYIA